MWWHLFYSTMWWHLSSSPYNLAQLALVYTLAGQRDQAFKILKNLHSAKSTEQAVSVELALIYTALGDMDEAFRWLEESYQEHSGLPFFIKVEPMADPLRSDPRYTPFLRKMGLEP